MNSIPEQQIKKQLFQLTVQRFQERVELVERLMQENQEAANLEEKSSAGDKFETGRSMQQLEKNMHAQQLDALQGELRRLYQQPPELVCNFVQPGTLVFTHQAVFYLLAGLGKLIWEDKAYFIISPEAPLAQALMNKRVGDRATFQQTTYSILNLV